MLSDLRHRLRALFRRRAVERELDEELRFHLDQEIDKHLREGVPRAEAERRARLALGGLEPVKEECRDARGVSWFEILRQDVRYSLRALAKSPGFAAVAVATLALGIGANTALFSVVSGVLLRPLPYPHPEELVAIYQSKPNFDRGSISYPNFRDWRRDNRSFATMAAVRTADFTLTGLGQPERIEGDYLSAQLFSLLGVAPVLGRDLAPGEDEVGAAPVVLITTGLWQRKLGGARDVIGRAMVLDGRSYVIAGVFPGGLDVGLRSVQRAEVFVPIGQWGNNLLPDRAAGLGIRGLGRLKPGIGIDQARADLQGICRDLALAYPESDKGVGAGLLPLEEQVVGNVRPYLLLLLVAVMFVLLIACVNVANLLLARTNGRGREFAIRRALGAGRDRVVRQLITEGLVLALAGGALGLLVAAWGTHAMLTLLPTTLPRASAVGVDGRVLAFTALISIATGVFFGVAPALRIGRWNLHETLKEGGRSPAATAGAGRHRAQSAFVVIQVALAVVLLVGAGLMLRTLSRLWRLDPGFDPRDVLFVELSLSPRRAEGDAAAARAALRAVGRELAAVPGVEAVSLSGAALPMIGDDQVLFWAAGAPRPASFQDMKWALRYAVEPGYLAAMHIPLRRGRFFTASDDERAPLVAVVDDLFVATYFPGEDPVGKRMSLDGYPGTAEIIGVVGHARQWGLDTDERFPLRAQMLLSFWQQPDAAMRQLPGQTDALLRYTGQTSPARLSADIRAALQRSDAEAVVYHDQTLERAIADSLSERRVSMAVLVAFAALALLLAAIGIYGVVSYAAAQRQGEIGIRMALGAQRGQVLRLVLAHGGRMAALGIAIGVVAAFWLTKLMASLLYGVRASDPATFVVVAGGLLLVALAASWLPARRATRVDPMVALRHE
jgi:putative ABC transport system permease protein